MKAIAPERCTLMNLATRELAICQFNPAIVEVQGGAPQYARLAPIGVPHQVKHYTGTENRRLLLTFEMDAIGSSFNIDGFRQFLRTASLPTQQGSLSAPPPLLVIWPGLFKVVGQLTEPTWNYRQVSANGALLVCDVRCSIDVDEAATRAQSGV